MRRIRTRWLIGVLSLLIVLFTLSFVAAAVLAEGALHPLLRRRASGTAALAYSIGQAAGATAYKVGIRASDGVALSAWWLVPVRQTTRCRRLPRSRRFSVRGLGIRSTVLEERLLRPCAGQPGPWRKSRIRHLRSSRVRRHGAMARLDE